MILFVFLAWLIFVFFALALAIHLWPLVLIAVVWHYCRKGHKQNL